MIKMRILISIDYNDENMEKIENLGILYKKNDGYDFNFEDCKKCIEKWMVFRDIINMLECYLKLLFVFNYSHKFIFNLYYIIYYS